MDFLWSNFPPSSAVLPMVTPCCCAQVTDWRAVDGLGKAPKLVYLTLFFNPVCKKKLYRPFTTNCCESLRGLDLHAVSDEEVVEGAKFCNASRFRTCSSALSLPQPLFKGLTEVSFEPTKQEGCATEDRVGKHGQHPLGNAPTRDALVLTSVLRRVQLLRKFHARNSPVVIGQRQIRRYLRGRFGSAAAIKIQKRVRTWIVEVRAAAALKDILRNTGELYLVQVCTACLFFNNTLELKCSQTGLYPVPPAVYSMFRPKCCKPSAKHFFMLWKS